MPTLEAAGASEQYVLKPQGIYCEAKFKDSIEEIADANNDRSLRRAVGAAVASGECINSGIDVPSLIDKVSMERTPRGALYYCYVFRGDNERQCSDGEAIATVAQLQANRTGNFRVAVDNDKILVAQCAEGGRVYIEKDAQWRRRSAVFFDGNDATSREHTVNQDKERAVRDGCRGLDY